MATRKTYPLEIEGLVEIESGGFLLAYYSKGLHDRAVFLKAALECDESFEGSQQYLSNHPDELDRYTVRHCYAHKGPNGAFGMGYWCFYEHAEPGPGRFPVTIVDIEL